MGAIGTRGFSLGRRLVATDMGRGAWWETGWKVKGRGAKGFGRNERKGRRKVGERLQMEGTKGECEADWRA